MRKLNKKVAAVAVAAVAVAGTGVAYAYWTTTGAGTGDASARGVETGEEIVLTQAVVIEGLYPDAPAQDIMVTATNPAPYDQMVGEVTVEVTYPPACPASNWAFSNVDDAFGVLQAANAGDTDENTLKVGSIRLVETGFNQDLCKNAMPTFEFSSAAGEGTVEPVVEE